MSRIIIEKVADDRLSTVEWVFQIFDDLSVVLDEYNIGTRPTTRHKFQYHDRYCRLFKRDSTIDKPEVPPEVVVEFQVKLIQQLKFKL